MELEEGKIVWTCQPSMESGSYYGYDLPSRVRQVKLRLQHGCWYGHSFNYETGDISHDPNSIIFARDTNCFSTKKEANDLYIHLYQLHIEKLQDELKRFEETRED